MDHCPTLSYSICHQRSLKRIKASSRIKIIKVLCRLIIYKIQRLSLRCFYQSTVTSWLQTLHPIKMLRRKLIYIISLPVRHINLQMSCSEKGANWMSVFPRVLENKTLSDETEAADWCFRKPWGNSCSCYGLSTWGRVAAPWMLRFQEDLLQMYPPGVISVTGHSMCSCPLCRSNT